MFFLSSGLSLNNSQIKALKLMINMSIRKTLEILILELIYPIMGKMGLNAYYLSERSY